MFTLEVDDEIELRLMEDADAERLFALIDDCREYLERWLPWVRHNTEVDDSVEFIRRARRKFGQDESIQTGIVHEGDLQGVVGIHLRDQKGEVGYWLHRDAQSQGLATRSCRALIDYAFEYRRLHRVVIRAAPDNERSCAIPRRLGFTREGRLREAGRRTDRYLDLELYSLLRREWKAGELEDNTAEPSSS